MGELIIMPKQGLQMTEGMITAWLVSEGQEVKAGEPLFEMETDKLAITIDSTASGTLLKILCEEGETAEVAAPIAVIGNPGENYTDILSGASGTASAAASGSASTANPGAAAAGNIIIMPKQGLQMTEGMITAWLASEGDEIKEGQPLFEMETDKLAITIDSTASGTLLKILCEEGETAEVAAPIAVIGPAGADYQAILSGTDALPEAAEPVSAQPSAASEPSAEAPSGARVFSSPRARMCAEQRGIDYRTVPGTGPMGMVIERDIQNAKLPETAAAVPAVAAPAKDKHQIPVRGEHQIPVSNMRRIIAGRMLDSLNTLAQANHRLTVDMSAAAELRSHFKSADLKISYNDIVIRCVAKALTEFPMVNATMDDKFITTRDYVNIGMAVATDNGLLVPVIRDADLMNLQQISAVSKDLAARTKENKLTPDELTGGTFTISNLGMFDIESFTAVINKPEAGILAVGKIEKKPVVINDEIVIRPMMQLSLTYDHRILDGAPAALFLRRIKELLEHPYLML